MYVKILNLMLLFVYEYSDKNNYTFNCIKTFIYIIGLYIYILRILLPFDMYLLDDIFYIIVVYSFLYYPIVFKVGLLCIVHIYCIMYQ